ncbi:YgiT-type zinc finger protein [Candidatus Saganbacteria bacterium]|uniref:YgiT-type zinc finger protein n=1 Tax=Candidatus Saganbacteria bacterium TaxID=2575572 RepID=A0A9D6ULV3_UNCSA|nr:YgiT-type zinc finger protein [Candidatus Saganbacteria bacterium]
MPDNNHQKKDDTLEKYKNLLPEEPTECQACGGPLELEKVNLEDYQRGKLYLMEGVPAYVCQECGEIWVPEPIMKEFEKMIETAQNKNPAAKTQDKTKRKDTKGD